MKAVNIYKAAVDVYQWDKWSVDSFDHLDKWSPDHLYKNVRAAYVKVCIRGGYYEENHRNFFMRCGP